jgi:hypothetical protein
MKRPLRLLAVVAALLPLVGAAVYLVLHPSETSNPVPAVSTRTAPDSQGVTTHRSGPKQTEGIVERVQDKTAEAAEEKQAARAGDQPQSRGPRAHGRKAQAVRAAGGAATEEARRFFAAFSLYEIGRLDGQVRATIAATATTAFARELLTQPPVLPPGMKPPPRASLASATFIPAKGSELPVRMGGVVVAIERAGKRTDASLEMRLVGGRWRVAALGQ